MSSTNITDLGLTDAHHACACGSNADRCCACGSNAYQHGACGAGGHGGAHAHAGLAASRATGDVVRAHYLVEGMTCSHCVASVTEELTAIDGVTSVSADLKVGGASRIMVVSTAPVPVDGIRAAIDEAGYTLVDSR